MSMKEVSYSFLQGYLLREVFLAALLQKDLWNTTMWDYGNIVGVAGNGSVDQKP